MLYSSIEDKHIIFVDGSCIGNGQTDAICSYAYYISNGPHAPYLDGAIVGNINGKKQTNNRGELMAFIKSLEYILNNDHYIVKDVLIISDSNYCVRIMNEWLDNWSNRGIIDTKENSDFLFILDNLRKQLRRRQFTIKAIHMNSHMKQPKDKNSDEYYKWNGNDVVDKYAAYLIKQYN